MDMALADCPQRPVLPAGAAAEMFLLPAAVHPHSRGSPKLSAKAGSSQGDTVLQSQDGSRQPDPQKTLAARPQPLLTTLLTPPPPGLFRQQLSQSALHRQGMLGLSP